MVQISLGAQNNFNCTSLVHPQPSLPKPVGMATFIIIIHTSNIMHCHVIYHHHHWLGTPASFGGLIIIMNFSSIIIIILLDKRWWYFTLLIFSPPAEDTGSWHPLGGVGIFQWSNWSPTHSFSGPSFANLLYNTVQCC